MLGIGLRIPRLYQGGLAKWLAAFIKRAREDGAVIEGKKCIEKDGEFLIENKRANIIVDFMGAYAVTQGGEGLEARACSAQEVNDLLYSPMPQTRFLFRAYDEGTKLENYYCLSNAIDILEGDLGIEGEVTHAYTNTGKIAVFPKNGVAPYTYNWSNGATTSEIIGLEKGEYRVQVKDAEGAIANHAFLVLGNEELTIVTAGLKMDLSFDATSLSFPAEGSAEFNGTSDYISLDSDITITSDGTISFWVYYESGTSTIVSQMPYTPSTTYFTLSSSYQISVSYTNRGSVTDKILSSSGVFEADKWEYITLTIDNYSPQLYVNGSAVTTTQTGTYESGESIVVNTMGMVNNIYWMNGNLANVAIWNRALHPDEINSIMWKSYSNLNAVDKNGLQAWYALDDITGTTVPDSTGNHNGTAN